MRSSTPLLPLLFLNLAYASPLFFPTDCQAKSCAHPTIHTPPVTNIYTNPHFPKHQLSSEDDGLNEQPIDNSHITPSSATSPSIALSATRPLTSAYLLSLSNPASKPSIQKAPSPATSSPEENLPAAPTSALPILRADDAKRYWASIKGAATKEVKMVMGESKGRMAMTGCGEMMRDRYVTIHNTLSRDYSDLMVVGIVILFLAVVVALEALEKIGDFRQLFSSGPNQPRTGRRGQIFLEDDEVFAFIVKKPFELQSPPPPKYKIHSYRDQASESDAEAYTYDSDASEKV